MDFIIGILQIVGVIAFLALLIFIGIILGLLGAWFLEKLPQMLDDWSTTGGAVMSENYKFFENIRCEFYPCHKGLHNLNCLFCYCPFYHDMNCGGDFQDFI